MKMKVKKKLILLTAFFSILAILSSSTRAQIASGGNYTLTQTVIANGGASGAGASNGGIFSIEGTIGQSAAGTRQQNSPYIFQSGFWSAQPTFAPTAAEVSISGQVVTSDGRGILKILVTMTTPSGETRTVATGAHGYFRFADIPAGETYIFSVSAKRYTFSQSVQVRSIIEDTDDLIFMADGINRILATQIPDSNP